MWGAPAEPADSYYEVRPECTDVPNTKFKIRVCVFFFFKFFKCFFFLEILDYLWGKKLGNGR